MDCVFVAGRQGDDSVSIRNFLRVKPISRATGAPFASK